jgi:hypothetical protein
MRPAIKDRRIACQFKIALPGRSAMLRSRRSSISAISCLAGVALSGACVLTAAAEDARVKEMKFQVVIPFKSEINVTSSDGSRWDTILPETLTAWVNMVVDTRHPGYVEKVGIFLGHCNNTRCGDNPRIFFDGVVARDYRHQTYLRFSASVVAGLHRAQILDGCNRQLQSDGATKEHAFSLPMTASFSANTRKAHFKAFMFPLESGDTSFDGGDHTRHANFVFTVNCRPAPTKVVEPPPVRHNVTVEDIKLFLTTYNAPSSGHAAVGGQCKSLEMTTRIKTDKAGPVKIRLWSQINSGPITSEIKTLEAAALSDGGFGADWTKWQKFNRVTHVQHKAEVLGGTFAPSTAWKNITVHCGGNLTGGPKQQQSAPKSPGAAKRGGSRS